MSDDLVEIRRGVDEIRMELALHDQKVDANVGRVIAAQEHIAEAVDKIGDATIAIKTLAEQMKKNGNGRGFMIDRKTLLWLLGLALGGSVAMGGGQELAHRVFHTVTSTPIEAGHP